jgi:hypothetical protein
MAKRKRGLKKRAETVAMTLTVAEAQLVYDLLCHRNMKLRTDAAYIAYSSAYNSSPQRLAEKKAQLEGAAEVRVIANKVAAAFKLPPISGG